VREERKRRCVDTTMWVRKKGEGWRKLSGETRLHGEPKKGRVSCDPVEKLETERKKETAIGWVACGKGGKKGRVRLTDLSREKAGRIREDVCRRGPRTPDR